jgi:hypothetical protein
MCVFNATGATSINWSLARSHRSQPRFLAGRIPRLCQEPQGDLAMLFAHSTPPCSNASETVVSLASVAEHPAQRFGPFSCLRRYGRNKGLARCQIDQLFVSPGLSGSPCLMAHAPVNGRCHSRDQPLDCYLCTLSSIRDLVSPTEWFGSLHARHPIMGQHSYIGNFSFSTEFKS